MRVIDMRRAVEREYGGRWEWWWRFLERLGIVREVRGAGLMDEGTPLRREDIEAAAKRIKADRGEQPPISPERFRLIVLARFWKN